MIFIGLIKQAYAALTTWVCAKLITFRCRRVIGGGDRV